MTSIVFERSNKVYYKEHVLVNYLTSCTLLSNTFRFVGNLGFRKTNQSTKAVDTSKSNREHQRKAKPSFPNTAKGNENVHACIVM